MHHLEVLEALVVEEVRVHDLPEEVVEEALQEVDVGQQKEEAAEEPGPHALGVVEEAGLQAMEVVVEGLHALAVVVEMEHHLDELVEAEVVEEKHNLREMEAVEVVVVCHVMEGEGAAEAEVEEEDLLKI